MRCEVTGPTTSTGTPTLQSYSSRFYAHSSGPRGMICVIVIREGWTIYARDHHAVKTQPDVYRRQVHFGSHTINCEFIQMLQKGIKCSFLLKIYICGANSSWSSRQAAKITPDAAKLGTTLFELMPAKLVSTFVNPRCIATPWLLFYFSYYPTV